MAAPVEPDEDERAAIAELERAVGRSGRYDVACLPWERMCRDLRANGGLTAHDLCWFLTADRLQFAGRNINAAAAALRASPHWAEDHGVSGGRIPAARLPDAVDFLCRHYPNF